MILIDLKENKLLLGGLKSYHGKLILMETALNHNLELAPPDKLTEEF